MKLYNRLKAVIAAGMLSAIATVASADDIFKGVRGPTNWQLDERIAYAENDRDVQTATQTSIFKYWNGKEHGLWAFAALPYKAVSGPNGSVDGIGDLTFGAGPRGQTKHVHWFSYVGATLPTGADGVGTDRRDLKCGAFFTYFGDADKKPKDQPFEFDGSVEYTITGNNPSGMNPPDELAVGFVAGGRINDDVRLVGGLTSVLKDNGDSLMNARAVFRYTWSPAVYMEIIADHTISAQRMPYADSITASVRWNIGKK